MLARLFQISGIAMIAIVFAGALFLFVNGLDASVLVRVGSGGALASHSATPHPVPAATAKMPVPAGLETPAAVQAGAHLFWENCVQCHGAPGIAPTVQGMNPVPPNLLLAGRRNDPAEVFLKVKNGIPGTAMPAWSDQLPDQSIWSLSAFLHHSRGISQVDFDALFGPAETAGSQESH